MKIFRNPIFIAILFLIAANIALFWKFYFKGLLPFPGDLLVSYYFPWNSGGFTGFDPWTTRKGVVAMDVIRQMYPWKDLIVDQLKSGQWPLWNPYNFSGTPLLANLQSSVFFPGNFVFFLLPKLWAWISLVVGLPLIFSFFSYLFLRSLKLQNMAAIFGAIALSNLAYITVWAEQLIVIQSIMFLPLILLLINHYAEGKKHHYFWFIPILLAFSFFGGHPQSVVYVYIVTFLYGVFKKIPLPKLILCFALSLGISAIQLLPSLELYKYSARENSLQRQLILSAALPWKNLSTILAPDFFGNPATFNFRGMNYDNFQAYFGVVAFLLALVVIVVKSALKETKFFIALALFGLLFALPPLAYLGVWFSIPVLSSGFPSRIIFIFGFAMTVLAAFGLDTLLQKEVKFSKKLLAPILITGLLFGVLLASTLFFSKADRSISLKNMLLPLATFGLSAGSTIIFLLKRKTKYLAVILIGLAIFEYGYFFNKYQPFAPLKLVFPSHPVISFLQTTGNDRYFGVDRAYIDSNFATYYKIFTPEGYDPLYIKNYGEFLAASNDGRFPADPPPSDAFVGKTDNQFRKKLFDIIAVKYLIDKTDDPQKDFGPNDDRFSPRDYTFIKQVNKWKYYESKSVLPRTFLADSYLVKNHHDAIEAFYNPQTDSKTLILEERPQTEPSPDKKSQATILSYSPNKLIINTDSPSPKLLFLSDNYYPGWVALVDGKETPIMRADYTFRAVSLDRGSHQVVFEYRPKSFYYGAVVSVVSLILLGGLFFIQKKKHD